MFRIDQLPRNLVALTGAVFMSAMLLSAAAPILPIA